MRIVIKATHIVDGGGLAHLNKMIEWFGKLAPNNNFLLIGKSGQENMFVSPPPNFVYKFYRLPSLNLAARLIWEKTTLHRIVRKIEPDLLFEPGNTGTNKSPCPKVSLIHNVAPFDSDNFADESVYQKFRNLALRKETIKSVKSSDGVILISEYCKNIISDFIDKDLTESAVIYHGKPENSDFAKRHSFTEEPVHPEEFILTVSHIYRYKKLYELVQGYLVAREKNQSLPKLFIAGSIYDKDYFQSIMKIINSSKHPDSVQFLGKVELEPLQELYRNCQLFLFSSVLENCPVTLIEAMANGCAIACSKVGVMPEMCADSALYFDPNNIEDIASKIIELHENKILSTELRAKAKNRADKYTWKQTATETLKFFEHVVTMKRKSSTPKKKREYDHLLNCE